MAPITLTARLTASDTFPIEIEDDETAESLSVIIYSLRPELGEDMRLVHKGRLLKAEHVLAQVGIKSGDAIAVAKAPAATPKSAPPSAVISKENDSTSVASTTVPTSGPPSTPATPATSSPLFAEAPDTPAAAAASVVEATGASESVAQTTAASEEEPEKVKLDPDAKAKPQPPNQKQSEVDAEAAPEAEEAPAPAAPEKPAEENLAEPQLENLPASPEEPAAEAFEIDASSAAGLRALADLLERGGSIPPPEKLAEAMREAASKIAALENVMSEFGQALHIVNMVSANSLRSALNPEKSEGGGSKSVLDSLSAAQEKQEETRSFLHKKGDSDLHELHRAAAQPLARQTSGGGGISGSGSCGSPSSRPLTKEEMDKARQARLAVLEAKQAEKKKEQEEAEEKGKSREALFNRPFTGPAKPLGHN
mmetsp:Transcript_88391/g.166563  ORF Transcript_88391/g.166563 Transcript_88391/m.166563 type:complete len:424 (-) Transcript_88391:269-1540(-)